MSEGSGIKVNEEATRSTAIACKRLIAVSYDDFQTELHPISRETGYFVAIYEIRGL
jgi:hypothetical protein